MDGGASSGALKDEEVGRGDFGGRHCFAHWQDEVQFCKDETRFGDFERMGEFVVSIRGFVPAKVPPPDDGENEDWIGDVVE